ncbi:MFS transporter [Sphingomonas sp. CLY1604]|uniref:MFS transporter n=1 Tax=Sphingomonas sp. CLY1604 TaxID=3457786 RepID=UPI003FD7B019
MIWGAILFGSAALLIVGIQPILLGALASARVLSEPQVGIASMLELFSLAVGGVAGPGLLNKGSLRRRVMLMSVLLIAINLVMPLLGSAIAVFVARTLAGFIGGLIVGACYLILAHADNPSRTNAIFMAVSALPQIVAAYTVPLFVTPLLGTYGGFIVYAIIIGLALLCSSMIPRDQVAKNPEATGKLQVTPALVVLLLAVTAQMAGIGAAWSFMERYGQLAGYSASGIAIAFAASLVLQLVGALLYAWKSEQLPYRPLQIVGPLAVAASIVPLIWGASEVFYIVLLSVFGALWLFIQPMQISFAVDFDPSRWTAVILGPLALIGLSCGPLVSAFFVREDSVSGALECSIVLLVASSAFFCLALVLNRVFGPPLSSSH